VPAFITFADAQALAASVLRDALDCGVYSQLPKAPTYPVVTVKRIGGVPTERHALDRARLQVDVWGRNQTEAFDVAAQARVVLMGMAGQKYTTPIAGFVSDVVDDLGLFWLPDPETKRDRYIFGVGVTIT
jgi:hypothetical protein